MCVCCELFLTCVGWHTRTCAHNLGFREGFDDEEEEEEEEEEGEVSEEKATSFGCGVCSVRLPVLQISKYRTARN